ncbi:glycosyltransferase family 4 protein [Natrinema salinisoli]|uniref:glycosyltransferase family 4 protein n=1 Tax=Natrinema salinisoli TaxID=2878535 RepID=UPI001CF0B655|nr:glycosyltransferase family 4 protein [Natrinema salinisoli]
MRILTLNYEFPPLGGGAAPVTESLASTLVEHGHVVDVVTMKYGELPRKERKHGIDVYRVPALRQSQSMSRPHEMLSYLPSGFVKARQLLAEHTYDAIHAHFIIPTGILAYSLSSFYDIPYFITAHGSDVPGYNPDRFSRLHQVLGPIWRRVATEADCIVSPSRYLADRVQSAGTDLSIEIIPNGFDYGAYDANRATEERILLTSRLFERKGVQHFLETLTTVDTDWEVVITGEGPYKDTLEQLANRLDLTVAFPGWVERETLMTLLETSAIYVFPSSHENCPVALQEAMAAGTAIIASKYSGTAEVIGNAGLTVDPENIPAFRNALNQLLRDPDMRTRLQHQARNRVEEKYDWDWVGGQYEQLLSDSQRHTLGTL